MGEVDKKEKEDEALAKKRRDQIEEEEYKTIKQICADKKKGKMKKNIRKLAKKADKNLKEGGTSWGAEAKLDPWDPKKGSDGWHTNDIFSLPFHSEGESVE